MCSLQEPLMIKDAPLLASTDSDCKFTCIKCKSQRGVLAIRQAIYCADCLKPCFTQKFRSNCCRKRGDKSKEKILLCFSGGLSSRALIHEIFDIFRREPKRPVIDDYVVLYIDDGMHPVEEVRSFISSYSIPLIIRTIYNEPLEISSDSNPTFQADQNLDCSNLTMLLRNSCNLDATQKEDLVCIIKNKIFFQVAKQFSCTKIYTAENATRTAIKIIELTSKGRGYSLPFEIGRNDLHSQDAQYPISLIRPLIEHSTKEVAYYCYLNGLLSNPAFMHFPFALNRKQSLRSVTENFIVSLEKDYSSTVSTVSKTASKFTTSITNLSESLQRPYCRCCGMPVPEGINEWYEGTMILNVSQFEDIKNPTACAVQSSDINTSASPANNAYFSKQEASFCYPCRVAKFTRHLNV